MNFKNYELNSKLREALKPDWKSATLPTKSRELHLPTYCRASFLLNAEYHLEKKNISLCGKNILEVGCGFGDLAYLMAKYEGTKIHAIDVDEYIVNQAPDLNIWNPKDLHFANDQWTRVRNEIGNRFPKEIKDKVTFETCSAETYVTPDKYDMVMSWDTLEHLIELPTAFNQTANALKKGGIAYHEYNPFFSVTGGHSLCTLDFLWGHCRLNKEDFEEYIREFRPTEEKQALNFYYKCLNRFTQSQIKEYAIKSGFEILEFKGETQVEPSVLTDEIIEDVQKIYPLISGDDLKYTSVHLILRKI